MSVTFGGQGVGMSGGLKLVGVPKMPVPTGADILVNHTVTLNASADRIGINTNYWEDSNARRPPGRAPIASGLGLLRPKTMRWPGGHKADGVTWFLDAAGDTVDEPTPRLCRFGDGEWPATDANYWAPSNDHTGDFTRPLYGLQAFLDDCAYAGAEPIIVVAIDTIHNPPTGVAAHNITKSQAIANAAKMVEWCNVTHDYGVRYWELGNESWSNSSGYTRGYPGEPEAYGADFADMAAAMKAVDPTILVGLNGNQQEFFETALAAAGPENVDFLSAHRYPFFNTTYTDYQAVGSPNMVSEANRAQNAINTLAEPHKSRIFVMMTETGFNSQPNDMGAGVIIAHILGAQLASPVIRETLVWNTHYAPLGKSHDALTALNALTPAGMAQALVTMLAPGKMVQATSSRSNVFAFASRQERYGRTAILLVSRSNATESVTVKAAGIVGGISYQMSGASPADTAPTITRSDLTVTTGATTVSLPPASVTMLLLSRLT